MEVIEFDNLDDLIGVEGVEEAVEAKVDKPKLVKKSKTTTVNKKQVSLTKKIRKVKTTKTDKELVQEFANGKNYDLNDPQIYYAILKNIRNK